MLNRNEMMEKVAGFTDEELQEMIKSVEVQRSIQEEISKMITKPKEEDHKCHLSEINVTCLIRLKAETMEDLLKDVTRFQNDMLNSADVSKFASVREMEIKKWNAMGVSACNMTIDYKMCKEDIEELNSKMFKFF